MRDYSFNEIEYVEDRELSLQESPGIYAWYRDVSSYDFSNGSDEFFEEIMTMLDSPLSDVFHAQAGYLYSISVKEKARELSESKKKVLRSLSSSYEGRQYIVSHLRSLKSFLSPLYIGKADNIRDRIGQHVGGESLLRDRLSKAGISLDRCYLSVVYMEGLPDDLKKRYKQSEVVTLLEDIITRLGPSAFVRRPG